MQWLKKIWRAARYGLLLHKLRVRLLGNAGILVQPYYWTQEGIVATPPPEPGRGQEDYAFHRFGEEEVRAFAAQIPQRREAEMLARLRAGKQCFGLTHRGRPAAAMWCDFTECSFRWHKVPLGPREAYLFDMYTLEAFRGANMAPYLRHCTYAALRDMGRDTFYSVTERFNAPARRFKEKLGAKVLWLGVGIDLFGKVQRHYILRRYRV